MVGGGTTFGNLTEAELDLFDMDAVPVSLGFGLYQPPPAQPRLKPVNPSIRALAMNHFWTGVPQMALATACPMVLEGNDMARLIERAPVADRRVEEELMPKWPRQRGLDPAEALLAGPEHGRRRPGGDLEIALARPASHVIEVGRGCAARGGRRCGAEVAADHG